MVFHLSCWYYYHYLLLVLIHIIYFLLFIKANFSIKDIFIFHLPLLVIFPNHSPPRTNQGGIILWPFCQENVLLFYTSSNHAYIQNLCSKPLSFFLFFLFFPCRCCIILLRCFYTWRGHTHYNNEPRFRELNCLSPLILSYLYLPGLHGYIANRSNFP